MGRVTFRVRRRTALPVAVVLLAGLLAAGCVNLAAIRKFADVSSEATRYTSLVDDYVYAADWSCAYFPPRSLSGY